MCCVTRQHSNLNWCAGSKVIKEKFCNLGLKLKVGCEGGTSAKLSTEFMSSHTCVNTKFMSYFDVNFMGFSQILVWLLSVLPEIHQLIIYKLKMKFYYHKNSTVLVYHFG